MLDLGNATLKEGVCRESKNKHIIIREHDNCYDRLSNVHNKEEGTLSQ